MPTCFVVMGFGKKTAFYAGKKKQRTLDLDKTFDNIIRPAVQDARFDCIRADEILHSTAIDKPMYEQLLRADIVVADISTSNPNAIYELGVRHGLRPWATIVMAEKEFTFPFDVARLNIMRYEHLGPDIGATEAKRAKEELTKRIVAISPRNEVDSPVFLFLPGLAPFNEANSRGAPDKRANAPAQNLGPSIGGLRTAIAKASENINGPADWQPVVELWQELRELQPEDPYVIQQLALATYKSEHPNNVAALQAAREVLNALEPRVSSDGETVGLWGAIHKRLWEAGGSRADLDEAIRAHERAFRIRNDHYNGINLAFLLNIRANQSNGDEAIADRVWAVRTRREVLTITDDLVAAEVVMARRAKDAGGPTVDGPSWQELRYWVRASRSEALFGMGLREEAVQAYTQAKNLSQPKWMLASTDEQLRKLAALLQIPALQAADL